MANKNYSAIREPANPFSHCSPTALSEQFPAFV